MLLVRILLFNNKLMKTFNKILLLIGILMSINIAIAQKVSGEVVIKATDPGITKKSVRFLTMKNSWLILGSLYAGADLMDKGYVVLGRDIALGVPLYLYTKYLWDQSQDKWGSLGQIEAQLTFFNNSGQRVNQLSSGETGRITVNFINRGITPVRNIKPEIFLRDENFIPNLTLQNLQVDNNSVKDQYVLQPTENFELSATLHVSLSAIEGIQEVFVSLSNSRRGKGKLGITNPNPPNLLITDIVFIDQDGNETLDGLESGELTVTVRNEGDGPAKAVQLVSSVSNPNVNIQQKDQYIGNLDPGKERKVTFNLLAGKSVDDGTATVRIDGKEQRGFDARAIQASIPTAKLIPSKITVDRWIINDGSSGLASGNNNRLIENGEIVEVNIEVENTGAGPVFDAWLTPLSTGGILPNTNRVTIGQIAPHASKNIMVALTVPINYKKNIISLGIQINDARNTVDYSRSITFESYFRQPELEFDYVIYDGNSPGSRGNQNGIVEQGERVELEILPQNLGDYSAQDVTFRVDIQYPGIITKGGFGNEFLLVGTIPAKKSGNPVVFPFTVQRSAEPGVFELNVEMEQSNFDGFGKTIQLELQEEPIQTVSFGRRNTSGFGTFTSGQGAALIPVDVAPKTGVKNNNAIAVVIGNRSYRTSGVPRVEYAERDARIFKSYLTRTLGLSESNIIFLTDANFANFTEIFGSESDHRGTLFSRVKSRSSVYIFYSGHGAPDVEEGTGYFVPTDSDPSKIKLTGYPVNRLIKNLSKLQTSDITVFIDACFSGGTEEGNFLIQGISPAVLRLKNPEVLKGISLFSASEKDQVSSWYRDVRHGLFTYYLLAGMQGYADMDENGEITYDELSKYLKINVPEKVKEISTGREQNPTFVGEKDKVLFRYKR